jgi:hypothetical protein
VAVTQVSSPPKELFGLSTDTKPTTNVPVGSIFWETDTKKKYLFSGTEWIDFSSI